MDRSVQVCTPKVVQAVAHPGREVSLRTLIGVCSFSRRRDRRTGSGEEGVVGRRAGAEVIRHPWASLAADSCHAEGCRGNPARAHRVRAEPRRRLAAGDAGVRPLSARSREAAGAQCMGARAYRDSRQQARLHGSAAVRGYPRDPILSSTPSAMTPRSIIVTAEAASSRLLMYVAAVTRSVGCATCRCISDVLRFR